jgi:choline monooxygenase
MFLGHTSEVEKDHWKVLDHSGKTFTLINDNGSYKLQDNICLHQGSRLREGTGTGLHIVCPYHAWSWNKDGQPISSGTVGHSLGSEPCANLRDLRTETAHNWSGFLFQNPVPLDDVDISGDYTLVEYRQDRVKSSFISIMDLFLDIDHIPMVHPELYAAINVPTAEKIKWKTWPGGSVQFVQTLEGANPEWAELAAQKKNPYGALWVAQYPYTQFEWQPGAVFVQVNQPVSDAETVSHIFKYKDFNYSEKSWQINEEVWETAWLQDRAQAERLEPGWRFRQQNLEKEKIVFRQFLQENDLI